MSDRGMCVLQCNCQRAYAVMCDLGEVMRERDVSVALLQEPYVQDKCVRGLPSSMDVAVDGRKSPKAAIVVNDPRLEVMRVMECTNEYGVCVWLKGDFGEMYVVSVYCQFGRDIEPYLAYLERVREIARGKRVLVGMDANAVSPLWYSKGGGRSRDNEVRGRVLEEWIIANDMTVLNEPCVRYTFSGPNGESDIDVTLVSGIGAGCCYEWSVESDWGISDHNVLLIRMTWEDSINEVENEFRWVCKGVDWEEYERKLRESALRDAADVIDERNADRLLERMSSWIRDANDWCMKKYERRSARKLVWWTDELERMKKRVGKLRRAYQNARKRDRERESERLDEYKCAVRKYKREIWRVKEKNWELFVSKTGNRDPWGDVYKVCMGKFGKERLSEMRVGDRVTRTWKESVDVLMKNFFPDARMEIVRIPSRNENENENEIVNQKCFEWDEVREAVKLMRLRKAPGLDGVSAEMLRVIWRAIPEWLKKLYDVCLDTMCFPVTWKTARVVVLLKSPERVRSDPGSYRPICLLSVLGKVLERMMVRRLERKVCDGMCDEQYGFRAGRSTEGAWNRVLGWVDRSEHKYVLGVFVDYKGAFDNLEWKCVIDKLREVGCEEMGLWESYFCDRRVCVKGVCESVWKEVQRGCPQGSVCGPFVWNLMMNDLLLRLRECECKVVAYADDVLLLIEGQSRVELERKGTDWMRIVSEWGGKVGVSVSESKTVVMLVKGSMSGTRKPRVLVNGKRLKYVQSVKYLGVWVSERMNFKLHLENLRSKCMNVIGKIRRVLKKEWGLRKRAMNVLYKGLISASVMYGARVWYELMRYEYARVLINRCQRVAMSACLNVCRTVSTEAMQVLMGGLPWDLECVRRGVKYKIRNGISMSEYDVVKDSEICGKDVNECMQLVTKRLYVVWQRRWNESAHGRVTHAFIMNVEFAEGCVGFEPNLYVGYILTGHGSLNEFLYKRGLSESEECACGAECEDWKHVLLDCPLYDDVRKVNEWGVVVREDGSVDVSHVLECKDRYESVCKYAVCVFKRRRNRDV